MSGSAYNWRGADGGSWTVAGNWEQGTTIAMQAPGSLDLAQFVSFSGTVTGSVGSQILDIGPASSLTLGGSGFFGNITIGQDLAFNTGDATLAIQAGVVVAATLLNIGSVAGGGGTLVADGTFSTTGGITVGSPGFGGTIEVGDNGEVEDSASNLSMTNGGAITVAPSGRFILGSGGGASGAFSIDGGFSYSGIGAITGNVVDNGSVTTANAGNSATVLSISGNVTGIGTLSAVQELDVGGAIGNGITMSLFGNGGSNQGLLRLAQPQSDAGTLATISTNSTIALSGLTYDTVIWTPGSLTMSGGSGTLTLATTGDFSHQTFVARPDPVSGTDIVTAACFAAGTRILTVRGPVAVEALSVGDRIALAGGGTASAVWIGSRTLDCTRHRRPAEVWPVRVLAGAFGPGAPERDLLLSPDHAVFVDDVLIPVRYLINGSTIRQETRSRIRYLHVQLPHHAVMLAEGLPVESFLAGGDHSNFINGSAPINLHPDFSSHAWEAEGCAPLVVWGPKLEAVQQRVNALAATNAAAAKSASRGFREAAGSSG